MKQKRILLLSSLILSLVSSQEAFSSFSNHYDTITEHNNKKIQVGVRPYYLINDMSDSELKKKLKSCDNKAFHKTDFSIGHRGASLQFPEHTKESYEAAARMGAGIIECDVTFTADKELVCRHSQCDLHATTNILATPLAAKCSKPFTPAVFDNITGELISPASAQCCTSDITLSEFKTLKGKMDSFNPNATNISDFIDATVSWRTDLYATKGTLMTHKDSIKLFKKLGVKMTPELKSPDVDMPYQGTYTQIDYAQQMINEYHTLNVNPENVFVQSFNLDDIFYWQQAEPDFAEQAVFLDDRVYNEPGFVATRTNMEELAAQGINIIAPPMWALVTLDANNKIIPSDYANLAKSAGLDIITWTLERSGPLTNGGGWYYQTITNAINKDGDVMDMLDVLATDVGVLGVFSDWPATVSYYANCIKDD